jgi:hypothetical protein
LNSRAETNARSVRLTCGYFRAMVAGEPSRECVRTLLADWYREHAKSRYANDLRQSGNASRENIADTQHCNSAPCGGVGAATIAKAALRSTATSSARPCTVSTMSLSTAQTCPRTCWLE